MGEDKGYVCTPMQVGKISIRAQARGDTKPTGAIEGAKTEGASDGKEGEGQEYIQNQDVGEKWLYFKLPAQLGRANTGRTRRYTRLRRTLFPGGATACSALQ